MQMFIRLNEVHNIKQAVLRKLIPFSQKPHKSFTQLFRERGWAVSGIAYHS